MAGNLNLPETIYHYTSAAVFEKIILNRELQLTDIRYMNDNEEYKFASRLWGSS